MKHTKNTLPQRANLPLTLVGMMGVGKTHIGGLLAARLVMPFYDTDDVIERKTGQKIADIFATQGEDAFRKIERDIVTNLVTQEQCVIATGGGAVTLPGTLNTILTQSFCVWVQTDAAIIYDRIKGGTTRPLLLCDDPLDKIKMLLAQREEYYARAHYHVYNNGDAAQRLDDIVLAYNNFCNTINVD